MRMRPISLRRKIISIDNVVIEKKNTVIFNYYFSSNLKTFFRPKNSFSIKYDFDITKIPASILVIPFVTNVLPVAWLLNATLKIPELDEEFYEHIKDIKNGYETVYPKLKFAGGIKVQRIINNSYTPTAKVAQSFSGGVDSFSTLINHLAEQPELVTLIGSDIYFDDKEGIKNITRNTKETAKQFGLKHHIVHSGFHSFLNEDSLTGLIFPIINDGWWHAIQHGVGLIGHIAPIAYIEKIKTFYFPSTLTSKEFNSKVSCASYPIIDNGVHVAGMRTIHDGFELMRQQKVKNICDFCDSHKTSIPLRVCWQSRGGENCCKCEKCFRTMMAIIAERHDPNEFNFCYDKSLSDDIKETLRQQVLQISSSILRAIWSPIKQRAVANKDYIDSNYHELEWFLDTKIQKIK